MDRRQGYKLKLVEVELDAEQFIVDLLVNCLVEWLADSIEVKKIRFKILKCMSPPLIICPRGP